MDASGVMPASTEVETQRARLAVAAVFLVNGALFANWVARVPAVKDGIDAGPGALGLALLGLAAGSLVTMPWSGRLCERIGSDTAVLVSGVVACLALSGPALAPSAPGLGLALAAYGAAFGLLDVAMNVQAVAVVRRVGRPIMPWFHAAFSIGGLAGAATGALAAGAGLTPLTHFLLAGAAAVAVIVAAHRHLLPDVADVPDLVDEQATRASASGEPAADVAGPLDRGGSVMAPRAEVAGTAGEYVSRAVDVGDLAGEATTSASVSGEPASGRAGALDRGAPAPGAEAAGTAGEYVSRAVDVGDLAGEVTTSASVSGESASGRAGALDRGASAPGAEVAGTAGESVSGAVDVGSSRPDGEARRSSAVTSGRSPDEAGGRRSSQSRRPDGNRLLLAGLGAIAACAALGEGAMADWTALFLRDVTGTSAGVAALGFAAFSITMTTGRLGGEAAIRRLGAVRVLRFGGAAAATGVVLAVALASPIAGLIGFALVGIGFSCAFPLALTTAGESSDGSGGHEIATVSVLGYLGFLVGPPLIGLLAEVIELRVAMLAVALPPLGLVALARILGRATVSSPDTPPATTPEPQPQPTSDLVV